MKCCGVHASVAPGAVSESPEAAELYYLPRIVADADIAPALRPIWTTQSPELRAVPLPRARVSGDFPASVVVSATDVVPLNAGDFGAARTFVSDPLLGGIDYTGARAWLVNKCGTIVGSNQVQPAVSWWIRGADGSTRIVIGEGMLGQAGIFCISNNPIMPLWNFTMPAYVTIAGDRHVLVLGFTSGANATSGQWGYGSWTANPALSDGGGVPARYQAQGFQNTGNPGVATPYLEIQKAGSL